MENKAGLVWGGVVLSFIVLIIIQLIYAEKRIGGLSETFVNTFFLLEVAALVFAIIFFIITLLGDKLPEQAQVFGFLCSDEEEGEFRPFAGWPARIVVFSVWTLSIIAGVSLFGIQIFPENTDIGNFYGTSQVSSAYYQSVPQMFGEDLVFMVALPSILLFVTWLILSGFGVELSKGAFTVTVLLVCILTSIGSGYLIPGFAMAHEEVQGGTQNSEFFFSAAVFSYFQSVIYQLTGLFLPVAHFAHNLIVSMKWYYGIALGSLALKIGLVFPLRWLNKRCLSWHRARSS